MRRLLRSESGVTALEFALVSPLVLFTAMALFDLGRYAMASDTLDTAVKRAARVAIVSSDTSGQTTDEAALKAIVSGKASPIEAAPTVRVSWSSNKNEVGNTVTITATQAFNYISPFLENVAPTTITATTSMEVVY